MGSHQSWGGTVRSSILKGRSLKLLRSLAVSCVSNKTISLEPDILCVDLSHPEHKPEPSTSQDSPFNESSGDPRDLKVANRPDLKPAPLIPSRSITTLPEKSRIGPGAGRGMFPTAGTIPLQHRSVVGLPPRPRLTSAAMLSPLAERSAPSGEYERPRPAPLPRGPST